jgi:hypothetical protein
MSLRLVECRSDCAFAMPIRLAVVWAGVVETFSAESGRKIEGRSIMFRIIRQFFTPKPLIAPDSASPETTLVYLRVKPERTIACEHESPSTDKPPRQQPAQPHASRLLPHAEASDPAVRKTAAKRTIAARSVDSPVRPVRSLSQPKRRRGTQRTASGSTTALADLAIFSRRQLDWLRLVGCRTDRDLLRLTPRRLEKRLIKLAESLDEGHAQRLHRSAGEAPVSVPDQRIVAIIRRGRWAIRFAREFDQMSPREAIWLRAVHRSDGRTLAQDSAGMIRRDLQRMALSSRGQRMIRLDQIPDLRRIQGWIVSAQCTQRSRVNYTG